MSQYARIAQQPADISDPSSFPVVGSSASGPSQQERAAKARLAGSPWQSPGETRAREAYQGSAADSLRNSSSAPQQTSGHQRSPAALATDSHAVQSLESMHPWADTALLQVWALSLLRDVLCGLCILEACLCCAPLIRYLLVSITAVMLNVQIFPGHSCKRFRLPAGCAASCRRGCQCGCMDACRAAQSSHSWHEPQHEPQHQSLGQPAGQPTGQPPCQPCPQPRPAAPQQSQSARSAQHC